MNNSENIWQRIDVINHLRDVWEHASAAMPDWEIDFEIAADAVIAGDVETDDNEGLIASDDIIGQRCFGAIMSDGPWWIKHDE
jgi:hypothetical protein